jgi:hypothetical protein
VRGKLAEVFHASVVTDDFVTSVNATNGSVRHVLDGGRQRRRRALKRGVVPSWSREVGTRGGFLSSAAKTRQVRQAKSTRMFDFQQK